MNIHFESVTAGDWFVLKVLITMLLSLITYATLKVIAVKAGYFSVRRMLKSISLYFINWRFNKRARQIFKLMAYDVDDDNAVSKAENLMKDMPWSIFIDRKKMISDLKQMVSTRRMFVDMRKTFSTDELSKIDERRMSYR